MTLYPHASPPLLFVILTLGFSPLLATGAELPVGGAPPALVTPYFPCRMHTFIWRNWELVSTDRMAKVLGCTSQDILAVGHSMGLSDPPQITDDQWRRSYITIIRRNWHLLPYEQMLDLLGWDSDKLAYILKEDDFLYIKLGQLKPKCERLTWQAPTEEQSRRAKAIAGIVAKSFGPAISPKGEPPFAFVQQLSQTTEKSVPAVTSGTNEKLRLRYLYSYFALYGDPLAEPDVDPYPDGYLQRLASLGVNGVWMQAVLNMLAPSRDFPEFGKGWEQRLANLRKMVERAKRYGISIYLYLNEPRTMDAAFFARHPDCRGTAEGPLIAMCVSSEPVKRFLNDSLAHIFKNVPDLGGVFTISASENLTNCWSHYHPEGCPRCSKLPAHEVIAGTNRAIAEGVWRGNPKAKMIVWDWGWQDAWAEAAIAALPKDCWFMSVSEWSLPIERGGIKSSVGEYSLSSVGPGPRAKRHWEIAKKNGLRTVAKVQVGNTWEMAAVPYVPVMELVAQHMSNLSNAGLDGLMLGWTLGGYPSPNLELVGPFTAPTPPSVDQALDQLARKRFGDRAAGPIVRAWKAFSQAFREYPFSGGLIYNCPIHWGPANPLYATPTGFGATMVGIPYDDLNGWRAHYPAEVMADQFEKIAAGWQPGLVALREALPLVDDTRKADLDSEIRIAEVVAMHVKSVANQARFVMARDALASEKDAEKAKALRANLRQIVEEDMGLARRLYDICRRDSRIGFEATNHYWYVPLDLVEKVVNCRYLLDEWLPLR